MDFAHDLPHQLDVLTDGLDDPGTDLETILAVLLDDLREAIGSLLGVRLTIILDGDPVTLTSTEPHQAGAVSAASLQVPLDEIAAAAAGSTVTFYAARAGAFVDLAADIRHAYRLDRQVVIDGHLEPPAGGVGAAGVAGLVELSLINRAIGVLIGQGQPPETARGELHRRADRAGAALSVAAGHLLDEYHHPTAGCTPAGHPLTV